MNDETDLPVAARRQISPRRVGSLLMVFLVCFGLAGIRTLWLQSVKSHSLTMQANSQQEDTTIIPAVRGEIVDRNGQQLAVGEEAITLFADPRVIKDPVGTGLKIASLLGMKQAEEADLVSRLSDTKEGFVYIERQLPQDVADKVIDADIIGVGHYNEEKRIYPLNNVGGQLLGAVQMDNDQGIAGLELEYNNELTGTPGRSVIVRDPTGTPVNVLSLQQEVDGKRVQLTIDSTIQTEVERVLTQTVKAYHATGATAIVMNPRNGEIYAMANEPGINPNNFSTSKISDQRNRAVTDIYEPGSIFKIVTIGGALQQHIITPSTSLLVPGVLQVADRKLHDAEAHGTERLTVSQILIRSSNIGTVEIGEMLGKTAISKWIKAFGFGQTSGLDYPGEVQGLVLPANQWSGSSIGNIPIGQGVGVTAIQIADAYSAIANDGVMVQPHLLEGIEGEPTPHYPSHRVITAATARTLRGILSQVVTAEDGTGNYAKIAGYHVAGKTGTAEIASNGGYLKGVYNASFVGMVPADNPQLVTFVVVNHTTQFGGSAAAPAFQKITQFALQYLAIPPDGVD